MTVVATRSKPDTALVAAVDIARAAAVDEAGADAVGEHLDAVAEPSVRLAGPRLPGVGLGGDAVPGLSRQVRDGR